MLQRMPAMVPDISPLPTGLSCLELRVSLFQELFYVYLFVDCVYVPLQMCVSPETTWGSWFSSRLVGSRIKLR